MLSYQPCNKNKTNLRNYLRNNLCARNVFVELFTRHDC